MKYMVLLSGVALWSVGLGVQADPIWTDDGVMGLYEGTHTVGGAARPVEAYVIGRGDRNYEVVLATPPDSDGPDTLRLVLRTPGMERVPLPVYTSTDAAEPGVRYAYYHGQWSALPDFDQLTPVKQGALDYFDLGPREASDYFGFQFEGYLKIEQAGTYVFFTASDDGSRLWVGDTLVVDNDGLHGVQTSVGRIALEPGMHPVTVAYFENAGDFHLDVWHHRVDEKAPLMVQGTGLDTSWEGVWDGDRLVVTPARAAAGVFEMTRVDRRSPALGRRPPSGAVALLPVGADGKPQADGWHNASWRLLPDGSFEVGEGDNWTRQEFGDAEIHVEFLLPYQPAREGQARSNSGVYVQGRYELQVLDSFGLPPADNLLGGVYSIAPPRVKAALPPLTWQTYEIVFRAPRLAADGSLAQRARFERVKLNGVLIHEGLELPHATPAGMGGDHRARGPLMLQDHGSPVRYRNVWIRPME
jgi:hypothetical protein